MIYWAFIIVLIGGVVFILARTFLFKSRQIKGGQLPQVLKLEDQAIQRFSQLLQFKTVSYEEDQKMDYEPFNQLSKWLKQAYPEIHNNLDLWVINEYGLVYGWQGSDPGLDPIILLAHMDVVPADNPTEWTHPPFSGAIAKGYIWGRGALDDKVGVCSLFESVTCLLQQSFQPSRSIYLAFGYDEEIGGRDGAAKIAEWFKSQSINPWMVLDEGLAVTTGIVPGIEQSVALIGLAEKGSVSLDLEVNHPGGHPSMPEKTNAVSILTNAIEQLKNKPLPVQICQPVKGLFKHIGPEMGFANKMVFANLWLTKKLVVQKFTQSGSGNATMRTTVTPTIVKAGSKSNVVPEHAKATLNARIIPGETVGSVVNHIRKKVNDHIKISQHPNANDPTPKANYESDCFYSVQSAIHDTFPDAITAPSLVLGATDARNYNILTDEVYRFSPIRLQQGDLQRIHGTDERISIDNFREAISFYVNFIRSNC